MANIEGKLFFGTLGGTFQTVKSTGGQIILFKTGTYIDNIQIGDNPYGGDGGGYNGDYKAEIPENGQFKLQEIHTKDGVLSYFLAQIGNDLIEVGTKGETILEVDLTVVITGIRWGKYVDAIEFDVIS